MILYRKKLPDLKMIFLSMTLMTKRLFKRLKQYTRHNTMHTQWQGTVLN
jgi:hypothetical protein